MTSDTRQNLSDARNGEKNDIHSALGDPDTRLPLSQEED